jgi:aminopeptidase
VWFDGKLIRKDGLFMLPALKKLNPDYLLGASRLGEKALLGS